MRYAGKRELAVARLPRDIREAMLRDAAAQPDEERCGVLLGTLRGNSFAVRRYVPVPNEAPRPSRSFRIGAHAVRAAQREAERAGLDVIGFCHSHPGGPTRPSQADLENTLPGYLHLIVDASANVLEGWRLRGDASRFDGVVLVEEDG